MVKNIKSSYAQWWLTTSGQEHQELRINKLLIDPWIIKTHDHDHLLMVNEPRVISWLADPLAVASLHWLISLLLTSGWLAVDELLTWLCPTIGDYFDSCSSTNTKKWSLLTWTITIYGCLMDMCFSSCFQTPGPKFWMLRQGISARFSYQKVTSCRSWTNQPIRNKPQQKPNSAN